MSELIKQFSINDVANYREDEDIDFAKVEIWAFAEGENTHGNPISREVLERDANTFLGKFIVAKFDKWISDCKNHTTDEVIVGYVDPREKIQFKTKEVEGIEKEFVVVNALLSKIYATEIVEMFRVNNGRTVSCEFSCRLAYEENENGRPVDENGNELNFDNPILGYSIHGITILGLSYNPSIKGTEIKVKRFAEEIESPLKKFANERKNLNKKKQNDLENKDKEDTMEDIKEMSEQNEDIVMSDSKAVEEEKTEEFSEDASEVKDKEMSEEESQEDVEKEMPCDDSEKAMEEECPCEEEIDDDKQEEKEMPEQEKEFSLKEFGEFEETEDEFANKVLKEMSAKEIYDTIMAFSKENVELKKFQQDRLNKDRDEKVDSIMAKVKEDLDVKTFSELREEGVSLSIEELDGFENKVKAFAYDSTESKRQHEQTELLKFGGNELDNVGSEMTADDIFNKYL